MEYRVGDRVRIEAYVGTNFASDWSLLTGKVVKRQRNDPLSADWYAVHFDGDRIPLMVHATRLRAA